MHIVLKKNFYHDNVALRTHEGDDCHPWWWHNLSEIVVGGLLRDTVAPCTFIIFLNYVQLMPTDQTKENAFKLKGSRNRQYPPETKSDVDYADD